MREWAAALIIGLAASLPASAQNATQGGTAVYQRRVQYAAPSQSTITTANVPVTVFPANTVQTGCDIINNGAGTLYVDMVAPAAAGSATSIPLAAGTGWHCPYPPTGAVTATAQAPQSFVAFRY